MGRSGPDIPGRLVSVDLETYSVSEIVPSVRRSPAVT